MSYMAKDERRAQIINATIELVSRENLAAATTRRIAQETGCSLGQIHHHFASADELRAEAMCLVWARIEGRLADGLRDMTPRERILVIVACLAPQLPKDLTQAFECARRLWKEAIITRHAPPVRKAVADGFNEILDLVVAALLEGQENGDFPKLSDTVAVSLRLLAAAQGYGILAEIGTVENTDEARKAFIESVMVREGL